MTDAVLAHITRCAGWNCVVVAEMMMMDRSTVVGRSRPRFGHIRGLLVISHHGLAYRLFDQGQVVGIPAGLTEIRRMPVFT